jgi:hypothetical protein
LLIPGIYCAAVIAAIPKIVVMNIGEEACD